jgi:hypothetical protein
MRKPLRCHLGLHRYVRKHGTPDPNDQVCPRCGKETNTMGFTGHGVG